MVRRINNWPDSLAGGVELFINDTDLLDQAEEELFNLLDIDLYVDKVTDKYIQIFDWLNLLNRNVVILLTIILFVAGTSIISILLILIMERTQMIGLMKAIGAGNKLIRSVFYLEWYTVNRQRATLGKRYRDFSWFDSVLFESNSSRCGNLLHGSCSYRV